MHLRARHNPGKVSTVSSLGGSEASPRSFVMDKACPAMDTLVNIQAHLHEINVVHDFIEKRKSELEGLLAQFQAASNRFLEKPNVTKADKRLVAFFATLGYVVLNANGSADNSASGEKKDWRATVSRTIAKNPSTLLPAMQNLYDGLHQSGPVEWPIADAQEKNMVRNLLGELKKAAILESCDVTDSGSTACFVPGLQSSAKKVPKDVREKRLWIRSGWAEKVFLYLVEKTFREFSKGRNLPVDFFWNVSVSDTPPYDTPSTEFDILACLNGKWYVFEAKAGWNLSIVKWVDRWHLFGEDKDDRKATIIQCAIQDFPEKTFDPLHLFSIKSFEQKLRSLLEKDFPELST